MKEHFYTYYMILWGLLCLIAFVLMVWFRKTLDLFRKPYWVGLIQGWKIVTFLLAIMGIVIIAPYTGDPTWDYVDAAFMSVFAFTTAPWVVGTWYQTIRGQRYFYHAFIACCIWMFSASWSYDLYLVIRDGYYPVTWFSNIFASSVLYISAGLFWSLEQIEGRGVIFSFMDPCWPSVKRTGKFAKVFWYALPFVILIIAIMVPFLL